MADLLVNGNGTLNLGMCANVKSSFIPSNPQEYEENMVKILSQLDQSWQTFLAGVKAPDSSNTLCQTLLRALFSLKPDDTITDRHAKVALLATMLCSYNQGPVGDCFAVADVLRDHKDYYAHAAQDYKAIIMNGMLQRPVNKTVDYFFFLPSLADNDLSQSINISASGQFPNTSYSLFDAPGFAAARDLMGGNGVADLTNSIMQVLSQNAQGDPLQVTPSQVIDAIAQVISSSTEADSSSLSSLGYYAFSSLTSSPIMRGLEAAFAAMAEDKSTDSTRGNVNNCVAQALQSTWDSLSGTSGIDQFQKVFTDTFNSSYRLLYNLNIPLAQVSSDGSSTSGGFQLYERIPTAPTVLGNRIATPQDFRQLVLDAIALTAGSLGQMDIGNQLTAVVQSDDFLKNVLWAYDQSNQSESDPVDNYTKLARTPMQSCDGDNPFEVDDVDTQATYDSNVQSHIAKNMEDLISWCLTLAPKATADMVPMDSPQHAFNFMPKNPDITAYVNSGKPVSTWLMKQVKVPGLQVSQQIVTLDIVQAVTANVYNYISNALPDATSYQQLVSTLSRQNLSVQTFAQKLVDGVNQLLGSDQNQANEVALAIDTVLLQNLNENAKQILSQSAIRFAFTNWNEGTKDIYFCAHFNPRTEQIYFGTILEDKTNLQPMDNNAWVNNQQWDVDLTPVAPAAK